LAWITQCCAPKRAARFGKINTLNVKGLNRRASINGKIVRHGYGDCTPALDVTGSIPIPLISTDRSQVPRLQHTRIRQETDSRELQTKPPTDGSGCNCFFVRRRQIPARGGVKAGRGVFFECPQGQEHHGYCTYKTLIVYDVLYYKTLGFHLREVFTEMIIVLI